MKNVIAVLCVLALTTAMSRPQAAGPNQVIAPEVPAGAHNDWTG